MRRYFTMLVLALVFPTVATEPFADSITVSKDGKYSVRIKAREDKRERILFVKTPKGEAGLTMEELGFDAGLEDYPNITTAGWDWYQNSITYIHPNSNTYAIRLKSSKTIYIDLVSMKVIKDHPTAKVTKEIARVFAEKAMKMLSSKNPQTRETGAIFAGQLKVKKAIPTLKKLLKDRSWFTRTSGDDPAMVILYVRQAAKAALESLGEKVGGVVTTVPEKGHVVFEGYRYVLKLKEDKPGQNNGTKSTTDPKSKEEW